jgi:hypothetical protein
MAKISLEAADAGDDCGENQGFDKASPDIHHIQGRVHTVQVGTSICPQQQDTGDIPSDNADEIKKGGEQGKTDD